MTLSQILEAVELLTPEEQEQVYKFLRERREQRVWQVAGERIARINDVFAPVQAESAELSEDEVNADIDEALAEVRGEAANRRH